MTLPWLPGRAMLGLLLVLLILAPSPVSCDEGISAKVLWVFDGDTLQVEGIGRVRLIGIDTPEREDSDRDGFYKGLGIPSRNLRRIAGEALLFTVETAKGKFVRLSFDKEPMDRHGRTLAYVILPDGRLLNRLLLERGLAVVYRRFDFRLKNQFLAAETEARKGRLGLWQGFQGSLREGKEE